MSDEIFDYFGGSSSRKVEPLDENEMFEDLIPKTEEPVISDVTSESPEIVDAELVLDETENDTLVDADADGKDDSIDDEEVEVAESHWDDLASTLGLEPVARPKSEASSRSKSKTASKEKSRKRRSTRQDKPVRAEGKRKPEADRVFDQSDESGKKPDKSDDIPAEMFVPADDDFDAGHEVVEPVAFDDDPFAAFSGSGSSTRRKPVEEEVEESTAELDSDLSEIDEADSDPDFVEFEVKDVGGNRDQDRGPRRRRRNQPESRSRETRDSSSAETDKGRTDSTDSTDSDRESTDRPPRRRKRSGNKDRESTTATVRDGESRSRDESKSERGRGHGRDGQESKRESRESRGRTRVERDHEDDDKKKPKIPTWEDAISGVVEDNIKRHKSNTGRGGKRRRN